MRKIKFRIWDEEAKKFAPINCVLGFISSLPEDDETIYELAPGDFDLVIEQYTGLKDKNGVEIYEGDVYCTELSPYKYTVFVKKGAVCGGRTYDEAEPLTWETWGDGLSVSVDWISKEIEVIGNIHEEAN